jgi:hypothetical protein
LPLARSANLGRPPDNPPLRTTEMPDGDRVHRPDPPAFEKSRLVEGESDCQTLWHHNFPAIGLPGASNWNDDRDADHFDGIEEIFAIVEPGKSGQSLCDQLRSSRIKDRVWLVTLPVKDASELHLADPKNFGKLLLEAIDAAESFADWEARQPKPGDIIDEFNKQFMVVNEGGKCVVYAPRVDPTSGRTNYDRITFDDFHRMYLNREVWHGKKLQKASKVWLEDPNRKQYLGGIVFNPLGDTPDNVFNLWKGLAIQPKAGGSWAKLKDHIRTVICQTQAEFDWLLRWMARLAQFPGERGEIAVVLRGEEGVGKGTMAKALMRIIGQHAMQVAQARHLTGNFNSHLRDCVFLFADEAFFAGDRQHEGLLKALSPNYIHLMIASNKDWVVPAGPQARRFAVFEVGDAHINNQDYFGEIWQELNHFGLEAMLDELLKLDIADFNFRRAPATEGLQLQKQLSLPPALAWWQEVLRRGYVHVSKYGLESDFEQWMTRVSTELLYTSYKAYVKDKFPMNGIVFGKFMTNEIKGRGCRPYRLITGETNEEGHPHPITAKDKKSGYDFGTLGCVDGIVAMRF